MDDPVIARADGSVLYNFAVAVDDLDAGITHVVRGEDHLSNTPKQLLVFEALGAERAVFAHLPLLHGPDGKKLSKRHGAASVQELRDAGYLPEAVRNYLALLGWGDDDDQTILVDRGARRAVRRRARLEEPGAVRRAEAALAERPLPARADRRRPHRAPGGASPGARGLRDAVAISPGEDPDAGRLLAAGRVPLRRPGRRPQGRARSGSTTRRRARARAGPRGARATSSRSTVERIEVALREVVEAGGAQAQGRLPADPGRAGRHDGLAGHLRDARGARPRRVAAPPRRRAGGCAERPI